MNLEEKVLGFAVRKDFVNSKPIQWDDERRSIYLLKVDIKYPLSIDSSVWPEADDCQNIGNYAFEDLSEECNFDIYKIPKDLTPEIAAPNVLVAFVMEVESYEKFCQTIGFHACDSEFSVAELVNAGWKFIGFDIAEESLISGLSNCGYRADELQEVKSLFLDNLNEYGLFDDLQVAKEFCEYSNNRVSEHAPFFVFGMYVPKND